MRTYRRTVLVGVLGLFLAAAGALAANSRLHDNGDGTVTDRSTGLTWVADPAFVGRDGLARDIVVRRSRALEIVAAMNRGEVRGFGRRGWRLPTARELAAFQAAGGSGNGRGDARVAAAASSRRAVLWPVIGAAVLSDFGAAGI